MHALARVVCADSVLLWTSTEAFSTLVLLISTVIQYQNTTYSLVIRMQEGNFMGKVQMKPPLASRNHSASLNIPYLKNQKLLLEL